MESELSDVKIVLDDGTEVPAEVVLRDKDNDLAFIRPKTKPAAPMAALDLANSGKADILDQVISLTRLGSAAGRAVFRFGRAHLGHCLETASVLRPRDQRDHHHHGRACLYPGRQALGRLCHSLP